MGGTDTGAAEQPGTPDTATMMARYSTRAGLALSQRAETYTENTARTRAWLRNHPRDAIRQVESHRHGIWHECVRDNRQICEADDLGMLMNRLEADFDTPESRKP